VIKNIQQLAARLTAGHWQLDYPIAERHWSTTGQIKTGWNIKKYLKLGSGIIGSGAIEAAHRTAVQKRLKLSGQHWTKTGAQHMPNLRVTEMNRQWINVVKLLKTEFKTAA
jgi:hypothetical protein